MIYADLHLHSHYSRATSKIMDLHGIARGSRTKGLGLLGTGDFTHPRWLAELKQLLKPSEGEEGLYSFEGLRWMLQTEVSLIYTQDGRGRRIHHIILAPSFEVVDQINAWLATKGRLDYDGRPIFGFSSTELVENLMGISRDIAIIPAHCLLPGTLIVSNPNLVSIENITKGDCVYTHRGHQKRVTDVHKRHYNGQAIRIVPWYFSFGLTTTPEHPYFAIKVKQCKWKGGICKPTPIHFLKCEHRAFESYKPEWVQAKDLSIGDILVFPRFNSENHDIQKIVTKDFTSRKGLPETVSISADFCRLLGYYLSEGYSNSRDAIGFSFSSKEQDYISDVKNIVNRVFGLSAKKGKTMGDVIVYSWALREFFEKLCYSGSPYRAWTKSLPQWVLQLTLEKQAEILRGWWRGDKGYTCSRLLAHQMRVICLRLGIVPSLGISTTTVGHMRRGKHLIGERTIVANHDLYALNRLAFFEDKSRLLDDPAFSSEKRRSSVRHGWIDENFAYLPIRMIEHSEYNGYVYNLEVEDDQSYLTESATVHNCWTPWYAIFGSKSGFDSIDECFGNQAKHIFAIETGMSSDPAMNWRISKLDRISLISNSDSHSPVTWRLGREANVFDLKKLSYRAIIDAIRTKKGFAFTIETPPEYGKYHWDGHRLCNVEQSPAETVKRGDKCKVCNKPLTIGVAYRVEELADRPEGFRPEGSVPFKSLIPLAELISVMTNTGVETNKVREIYETLIARFGNEFHVLLDANEGELLAVVNEKLANLILRNRAGKIKIKPGYDGVYGKPMLNESSAQALGEFVK